MVKQEASTGEWLKAAARAPRAALCKASGEELWNQLWDHRCPASLGQGWWMGSRGLCLRAAEGE